jgi:hypothetical protein
MYVDTMSSKRDRDEKRERERCLVTSDNICVLLIQVRGKTRRVFIGKERIEVNTKQ